MDDEMVNKLLNTANIMDDIILNDLGMIDYARRDNISGKGTIQLINEAEKSNEFDISTLDISMLNRFINFIFSNE